MCRLFALLEPRRDNFVRWWHGLVEASPSRRARDGEGTFRIAPTTDPLLKLDLTEEPTYSSSQWRRIVFQENISENSVPAAV
jgi:hypothetical protein